MAPASLVVNSSSLRILLSLSCNVLWPSTPSSSTLVAWGYSSNYLLSLAYTQSLLCPLLPSSTLALLTINIHNLLCFCLLDTLFFSCQYPSHHQQHLILFHLLLLKGSLYQILYVYIHMPPTIHSHFILFSFCFITFSMPPTLPAIPTPFRFTFHLTSPSLTALTFCF